MRTELDADLSMQRYMGLVLPPPWDVRRELEAGMVAERPYALITRNGPTLSSGPIGALLLSLAFTVHLYPAAPETREAARDLDMELRQTLWQAVEGGVGPARPRRLPLWDFDPETVPAGEAAPFRSERDFLRVDTDPSISSVRDGDDPRVLMVALDVRCTFRRRGPVPSGETTLRTIRLVDGGMR
jgi:hypothetical protein